MELIFDKPDNLSYNKLASDAVRWQEDKYALQQQCNTVIFFELTAIPFSTNVFKNTLLLITPRQKYASTKKFEPIVK